MDNRKTIQSVLDYIEENLKAELSVSDLSDMTGYSLYHFYRLFQSAVGMPVMQYILRRKLLNAIYDISNGKSKVDAALLYGFETYAGFYKAFRREIGYTPSDFLKRFKVKKPYAINLLKEEQIMLTHKKITEILKCWDLQNESIKDIYYEETGERHENAYYIGDKYVLKATANLGELKKQISLTAAISGAGLYAADVVKTTNNEEYITDGEYYFILTERLDGSQIKPDRVYSDGYASNARFIGEIIGQLHLALKNVDAVVNDVDIFSDVVNWAMPKVKEIVDLSDSLCEEYTANFGGLYINLPKQIIHRDPNPSNIITCDDKWGFIDFELSEKNVRIFDPCYAATAILSETFAEGDENKLEKWVEIYKEIIIGYDSIVKLSGDEFKAVPYVLLSNQLIATAWFAEQEKLKDFYDVNIKMTRWIVNNFDKLKF